MKELQKIIHENSANLKNNKDQKMFELLDAVRDGAAPANSWLKSLD
ncbi:hypothetical protein [Xenorhabdus griffiniae]|uniref:Uncharacterized protein n=1 Tax=Xenorhabdus griffiniae TaxID=351672 RepID=A0ABY9XET1_9GAMM|nr:hypothetical protein [Xenorhabdus griffiniae]MBD1226014.1 hypothetical protein [Xenorhabdus griffiniae]MBE8585868.1 hypothetical protein [Xenorhabdus griffiniae]WMV71415.1 hypothetical protein QL128_14725 [Xenorhabdus griffiniae]WNH01091.1 hypothetical protein QL112_014730 [Xenorhabdus griffiniae]